jgi:hypothetical protein
VLKRLQRKPEPGGLSRLEQRLVEHMTHVDIVDALSDTEHWLNWSRFFGPISGHDAKAGKSARTLPNHHLLFEPIAHGFFVRFAAGRFQQFNGFVF